MSSCSEDSDSDSTSSSSDDIAAMSAGEYRDYLFIPLKEIKTATNNFADENLLKNGTTYNVYKGQFQQSGHFIDIVVRVPLKSGVALNETGVTKNLKHKNIASLFKISLMKWFIVIHKHEANESLDKHLNSQTLTWMQRLNICVGVARALSYLHYDADDDHYVIHGNIKSSKILLDHNWEPKLHGFAFAVRAKKHHLHLTSKYNGALHYMDPAYEDTGGLTHKSDVFSFGVLLFEVLFGREAYIPHHDKWYFCRLARSHFEERKLDDLIAPDLWKKMNVQSFNIFAETAYCCLKEKRSQRPNMNQILLRLERALELQHKHEHSTLSGEGTSSNHLKEGNLVHLKFRLSDIELATNNFSKTYCIGSGGYGVVYKAELEHSDGINSLVVEGKVKDELSKKRSTVAIKRIFSREDEQGKEGFFAEIEMLSNCKHPNIVSLLGFCDEGPEMLLVYEYASNGSLDDYLGNIDNMTTLTWAQRIQICLDIAHGLSYLHRSTTGKQSIIHRDIKSANILLDDNWVAKIADFGLSKLHPSCKQGSTLITYNIAGTDVYLDPEYLSTGKLKTKSDIYSFGVVMFEIMCGKLAYDKTYNEEGLPSVARHCFNEGTLEKLVDPNLKETDEVISMLNGGVNQDSLDTFSKIAHQCLAVSQSERPTLEVIIKELEKALYFQENNKDSLHISLEAIKSITQNFSDCNCIGEGRLWRLYEGEFVHANGCTSVIAKRWNSKSRQGHVQFFTELETLKYYKHKNIIGLVGYYNEMSEKIIVYENASNGRLSQHLDDPSLTWIKRLKICIDIANGLLYLHGGGGKPKDSLKHRDIKSGSILLDSYWNAKISNLELSQKTTVYDRAEHADDNAYDSLGYIDPSYQSTGYFTEDSDTYSLGVVLMEILCGRLAWAEGCKHHYQSLARLAIRHHNNKGNLDEMIFEGIKEQIVPQSLTTFQTTAIECLHDNRYDRPWMNKVVRQLTKALEFQEEYEVWEHRVLVDNKEITHSPNLEIYDDIMKKDLYDMFSRGIFLQDDEVENKDSLRISLETIKVSTQNFSDSKVIGEGRFWKLYEGELVQANVCTTIVAKRWDTESRQRHIQFFTEFEILHVLLKYNHENIIGLVGYCNELNEKVIVYEHVSNGSLSKCLGDPNLTWMKRLKICIDVANGLEFLHFGGVEQEVSIKHRDIRSGSILLDGDWNAKISNLEFSRESRVVDRAEHVDKTCDSLGYVDPDYQSDGFLTESSDIYSLGVILFEMLCGRLAWSEGCGNHSQSLGPLAVRHYNEKGDLDEMIFEGIKEQIAPQSLTAFQTIAIQCLHENMYERPWTNDIIVQLKKALEFQEDYEIWEPKLPIDYKEIIMMSKAPEIYDNKMKKEMFDMFSKGILLQDGKVWFSVGTNGERNEMISAKRFSYKNHLLPKWRSLPESRFPKVAEMFYISNLNIKIKIRTQFLSPSVNYKVHLIFRFCAPRKAQAKRMYVNLKYKMGNETLHAYFATRGEDGWMMIELFQFLNHKKDTDFEVLLESFSRCYCGSDSIYIEGIQFQGYDNVKHEEMQKFEDGQQLLRSKSKPDKFRFSPSKMKVKKDHMTWFSLCEIKRRQDEILSAEKVVYNSSNVAIQSRFNGAIELKRQQVLHIKCNIKSQMLSANTENACYLVFKLSEKLCELHGPVIVRDLYNWRSKETGTIYFRYPDIWNIHDADWVPERRKDGWMEVIIWKFNSDYEIKNDHLFVNLKLITYEGTMSGLIVRGIKFRPI